MPATDDTSATLDVRYVPDGYTAEEIAEGADWPLGAGTYFVGVVYKGAFLPLAKFGGGKIDKLVGLAQAAASTEAPPTDTTPTPPAEPPAA